MVFISKVKNQNKNDGKRRNRKNPLDAGFRI